MDTLIELLNEHGYIILFLSLMLELIALPIPTEILMSYVGYLVYQGEMNWWLSMISGMLGCISGMTLSYWIGAKLGSPFFQKYGHRVHLGPERLNKLSNAFNSYGKRLLLVACFIPGVRHLTGYTAGITNVSYRSFAFFSYIGAVIWVGTFITLGKLLGPQYKIIETAATNYFALLILVVVFLVVLYYIFKGNKERIKLGSLNLIKSLYTDFRSRVKLKLLIAGAAIVFISFSYLLISLVEDFVNHEFENFNQTFMVIFRSIFDQNWRPLMRASLTLSTTPLIAIVGCLIVIWIILKGKNRGLEIKMLLIMVAGSLAFIDFLPVIIEFFAGKSGLNFSLYKYTDPSKEVIMATIVYGFLIFLVVRHSEKYRLKLLTSLIGLCMLIFIGFGHLFFRFKLPSDIISSYVLAGVWLSFIIMLLEIWRLIILLNLGTKRYS